MGRKVSVVAMIAVLFVLTVPVQATDQSTTKTIQLGGAVGPQHCPGGSESISELCFAIPAGSTGRTITFVPIKVNPFAPGLTIMKHCPYLMVYGEFGYVMQDVKVTWLHGSGALMCS